MPPYDETLNSFVQEASALTESLKKVSFSIPTFSYQSRRKKWNTEIKRTKQDFANLINEAQSPRDVFFALADLEKKCSKLINTILKELNPQKKISLISKKLDTLHSLNQILKEINFCMIKYIDNVIEDGSRQDSQNPLWKKLQAISSHIIVDASLFGEILKDHDEALANMDRITNQCPKLIVSALVKAIDSEKGQEFVNQMHSAFQQTTIIVQSSITTLQPGMAISPVDPKASFAQLLEVKRKEIETSSIESRTNYTTPSQGGDSALDIPITVPMEAYKNLGEFMSQSDIADRSLSAIMNGNLFYNGTNLSYLPFQLELYHELIHALHNAKGINYRHVPLNYQETKRWHTYEEYYTIKGNSICEADFSLHYGTQAREDHSGISTTILFSADERDPSTTIENVIRNNFDLSYSCPQSKTDSLKRKYHEIIDTNEVENVSEEEQQGNFVNK